MQRRMRIIQGDQRPVAETLHAAGTFRIFAWPIGAYRRGRTGKRDCKAFLYWRDEPRVNQQGGTDAWQSR